MDTYQLLDSGDFKKLEQVGPYRLVRPSPAAVWSPRLPQNQWQDVDAIYERYSSGSGEWKNLNSLPESWEINISKQNFVIQPTGFGHLGVFVEQYDNWLKLQEISKPNGDEDLPILNLFAYTGGSTIASALSGAKVTHVDASKTSVEWAKKNAEANNLGEAPIRWLVDDVSQFLKKEIRRGNQYRGIILDPPSYGQGPRKQLWKIEKHLTPLLDDCSTLLRKSDGFILLSCHSAGYTPMALKNLLKQRLPKDTKFSFGEMIIPGENELVLPSGASCLAQI